MSLAQVVGTLGAMAARLVAAPLNPTYHVEELEFFIGDAEAKVVVRHVLVKHAGSKRPSSHRTATISLPKADAATELDKAVAYRNAEVPFQLFNHAEVDATAAQINSPRAAAYYRIALEDDHSQVRPRFF